MHSPVLNNFLQRCATSVVLGAILISSFFWLAPIYSSLILIAIWALIMIFEWPQLFSGTHGFLKAVAILYPTLPFVLLILLNHDLCYRQLLPILFTIVFSFDTGSYVFGKLFGNHQLWPKISRKKTWEGVAGGYFFAAT